ncbi:hypothetical protein [Demequina aurantiaca]|uniref:hypothetical protein n=1 Tax=Demequina aurantiaca TaxID=676200 RepID=UPI003D349F80
MRKFAHFRRLVVLSAAVGMAIVVTSVIGLDRVALSLVGIAVVLLTALLFLADRRSRERFLPRKRRSSKVETQLDEVQHDVRRLVIDLEETQRRLVVSIETLRFENAQRASEHGATSGK